MFVFAITQVTALIADDPTWEGLARGMLILAVVWWAWVGYSWLTNWLDTQEDLTRIGVFGAMAAMFVVSLSIPTAFNDDALLFAVAYAVVRIGHILLYGYAANDEDVQAAVRRFAGPVFVAVGMLLAASFFDGFVQGAIWAVAIAVDFSSGLVGGGRGWKLHPGHFTERHGLIIIIAFGESLAQRAHLQPPPVDSRAGGPAVHPARHRARCPAQPDPDGSADRRADRLRGDPLPRGARAPASHRALRGCLPH